MIFIGQHGPAGIDGVLKLASKMTEFAFTADGQHMLIVSRETDQVPPAEAARRLWAAVTK
jgi:hypothetical protein